ncbi:hypothetical protein J7M23_04905, partial [Candidatus Sumerlaeota bacterium]|nr:hypothetical protein [Candidatus Sumerlaeota bacterium]
VEKVFYFCFPLFIEHGVSNWGIFEIDKNRWQPKPAYAALSNLINTLNGLVFVGRYKGKESLDNVTSLVFRNAERIVMVSWSDIPSTQNLNLQLAFDTPTSVTLRTLYGRERTICISRSKKILITPEPLFVIFAQPDAIPQKTIEHTLTQNWLQAKKSVPSSSLLREVWLSIRHQPEPLTYSTTRISGILRAYSVLEKPVTGEIVLRAEYSGSQFQEILRQDVRIMPKKELSLKWHFGLDKRLKQTLMSQNQEICLVAQFFKTDSSLRSSPVKRYLKFTQPVKWLNPSFLDETTTGALLSLRFQWRGDVNTSAVLSISAKSRNYLLDTPERTILHLKKDSEVYEIPISLKRLTSQRVSYGYEYLDANLSINHFISHKRIPLESRHILQRFTPINIDGKIGNWVNYPFYYVGGRDHIVHGSDEYEGEKDISAQFSLCWDEKALYLFVDVMDEALLNPFREETPWTGDAIELFLDCRSAKQLGKPSYDDKVFQVFFVPPDENYPQPFFRIWQPKNTTWGGLQYKFQVSDGKGYTLEAKLPWEDLGIEPPSTNRMLGFELTLDDIDPGDYEHKQLVWRGGANNWRDPSLFSLLRLTKSANLQ